MTLYTPCIVHRCHAPTYKFSRCEEHQPEPWTGTDPNRLPTDWNARRATVLARDGHTCQHCGQNGDEVDHKDDPYDHSLDNLQTLCQQCHAHKTHLEGLHGKGIDPWKQEASITPTTRRSKLKRENPTP